ncbi:MAG TPA: tyrosine-type recombinase/integrase [Gaiellaceae bacterium]
MKSTDFALHLTGFLTTHLAGQRNASSNTIRSYRDTFVLLLRYLRDVHDRPAEKVTVATIDARLVTAFLEHLQTDRHCSPRTCNQRLAALHAFARYVQGEAPEHLLAMQRVLAIPARRFPRRPVGYLEAADLGAVLAQPDGSSAAGRRDAVLLSVLYDTGARCQELIDLRAKDVRLEAPAHVRLTGKGRKTRVVPLMASTVTLLRKHMETHGLMVPDAVERPIFSGRHGRPMSRSGIRYLLAKHVRAAAGERMGIPSNVGPHTLRHSKAMHMLHAGVPLVIIRDILGHVDVKTTEVYARADLEMKRRALETTATSPRAPTMPKPNWREDRELMAWLTSL